MSTPPPLSHLGDLPIETFIAEYWHKKPLLIRQALAPFEAPLSADELAGLACEAEVESRLVIENPDTGDWQLQLGPFEETLFSQLPKSHWTLLVQAVDHWVPEAADLIEQFRFIPSWRLDDLMISYAADGGGVGPHYDNYDVFLLQVEGQRRWEVGGLFDEDSEFLADKPVRILKHWQPEQSWVLNPGDMLYLPPRVGHNGVATSDGCVTYSIGYRAPQTGDMLMQYASFCAQGLKDEDRYADPDLSLRQSSGEICQSDLQRLRSMFRSLIDDPQRLAQWFGCLMTEPKYPEHQHTPAETPPAAFSDHTSDQSADQSADQVGEQLAQSDWVRRSEGVRFAYWQGPTGLQLYVDGHSIDCTPDLVELLRLLCDQNQYRAEQLLDWCEQPAAVQLLQRLLAQDSLYCC